MGCCQSQPPPSQHEAQLAQNKFAEATATDDATYDKVPASPSDDVTTNPMRKLSSVPYKQRSFEGGQSDGAAPSTDKRLSTNGFVSLPTESAIDASTANLEVLERENKQLKQDLEEQQTEWHEKYEKLKNTLDNQAINYAKEIDLMKRQMNALRTELQQSNDREDVNEDQKNMGDTTEKKKEENEVAKRKRSDMVRRSQLLDLTKELESLREETSTLKKAETQRQSVEDRKQHEYEDKIKSLEETIKSLQISHENSAKPSFHKKTEEKNKQIVTKKEEEINQLREELKHIKSQKSNLESELNVIKKENTLMIERTKTMEKEGNEKVKSLQSTLKKLHSQHELDKETLQKEMKLLKDKDDDFINKIYRERDQFKGELTKMKMQFKEREHNLKLAMESLERNKIKAEDLADLANKSDAELREIIEKQRFTNRDLNDQINEAKLSAEHREQELEQQITDLNNIIKNKQASGHHARQSSTRNINALAALGAAGSPVTIGGAKKFPMPPRKAGGGGFAATASALAGKLPFGKKSPPKSTNKVDKVAALNAALLKKQGKAPSGDVDTKHKDDVKGAIGNLLAKKQKQTGQGPITDDTSSLLGAVNTYAKYEKMKKVGLPAGSIKNKMKMDGFDEIAIAKFFGEKPPLLNGIDLSKHDLSKYERMKKVKLPEGSIRNKMKMDGIDKKVIATFFGEKLEDDGDEGGAAGKPMEPPCPKPDMTKYSKMKKIGMPEISVKNKMKMDGIDEYWIRDFFGEPQPIVGGGPTPMKPPCPKPDMTKYSKMKKVGLPDASVKNKMKKDGIHEYWVRDFFGEPQPMVGGEEEVEEVMKEPHPKPDMSKYERMKKVKLPEGSIRNKMKQDGIHEYWRCVFFGDPLPKIKKKGSKKKKKVKRKVKPLHWNVIKNDDVDWSHTIWADINIKAPDIKAPESLQIQTITTQTLITAELTAELEKIFTNIRPKKDKKKGGGKKKQDEKKEITLIDPKRAFNMIVGLRQFEKAGIDDIKLRNYLLKLDDTKLNLEMLENLSKFVPSNEELNEIRNFKGDKEKLARGEKFCDVMTCMVDIKMRIDLWQFKIKFKDNVFEIESRIEKIRSTLDKLKTSPQIASFLKICLIIGNFMNEGTNRGGAKGIKLESIDRFASLKTADNSMTMLMFIMSHIDAKYNQNGEFSTFPHELNDIVEASKKIEAKTIRDGIADMKDSLERIGKRITRTSRNLQTIQDHFHQSVGRMITVISKFRTRFSGNKGSKSKNGMRLDLAMDSLHEDSDMDEAKENMMRNSEPLLGVPLTDDDTEMDGDDEDGGNTPNSKKKKKKKRRTLKFADDTKDKESGKKTSEQKKGKTKSFVDELLFDVEEEEKNEEKFSKYRNKKKPPKFVIVDPTYKGSKRVRKRKEHDIKEEDMDNVDNITFDMFTRGETMIDSDPDFDDIDDGIPQSNKAKKKSKKKGHQKTSTGLKRKRKKLKKVKIRRMKRVRKKEKPKLKTHVSSKTAKTIKKLKEQKEIDQNLVRLGIDKKDGNTKRPSASAQRKSISNKSKEDPSKPPSDKFESMMTGFHTMACNKVDALEKQFVNLKLFAGNVAVYFGEHDDLEWEELFKLFLTFFEQIAKARKQNDVLKQKKEKERKKAERERLKKERLAKKGLKPKKNVNGQKSDEPVNILEEIKMKNAKGTLKPSQAKNDIVGYEKVEGDENKDKKGGKKKKKKKKNPFGGGGGMSLLDQIKSRGDKK